MRLFFALEVPEGVRRALAEGLAPLRRALPPARWVRPEGVHLTLKFLGEQPAAAVDPLLEEVAQALPALRPVQVQLGGAGFFPSPARPRVAWVGGAAPGLEEWARHLEGCASRVGVPEEGRPFAVHLTLARLERPWGPQAVAAFVAAVEGWRLPPFTAREVVLFRSELGPGGARYTALARRPVGGEVSGAAAP